eukprot:gene6-107_t
MVPGRPGLMNLQGKMIVEMQDHCWPKIADDPVKCCENSYVFEKCFEEMRQTIGLSFTMERCCEGHLNYTIFYREMQSLKDHAEIVQKFEPNFDPQKSNQVLVFLHDRKVGGRDFKQDLFLNVFRRHRLKSPLLQYLDGDLAPGGTHFLPSWAGETVLNSTQIIAGHYDWHTFGLLKNRKARCLIAVRHPVERFISYVLQRSQNISYWLDADLSDEEFEKRLESVRPENMVYHDADIGLYSNLKMNEGLQVTGRSQGAMEKVFKMDPEHATEQYGWRELGGPHNSLLQILDPDFYDVQTAQRRLEHCLIVRLTEDRMNSHRILNHFLPWLNLELWDKRFNTFSLWHRARVFGVNLAENEVRKSRQIFETLPARHLESIAKWQKEDMILYNQALRQYSDELKIIENIHDINARPENPNLISDRTNTIQMPIFRWLKPNTRRKSLKDAVACAVGSRYRSWYSASVEIFGGPTRFPRKLFDDENWSNHDVFGACSRDKGRKFRPAALLVEKLWCGFDEFYKSNISGGVEYFDEVVDMIQLGRPLGRCLDSSVWPFTRKQLLINIQMFYKIAHSVFTDVSPPIGFIWLSAQQVKERRIDPLDIYPYIFWNRRN